MRELFIAFLETPSRESYLPLRVAQLSHPRFNPYAAVLDGVPAILTAQNYKSAVDLIKEHMTPDYLLSPAAHLELGFAYESLQLERDAKMERFIGFQLVTGIESTGDGTENAPFLVTRTSDEYDVINHLGLTPSGQALCSHGDRHFDRMETKEGKTLWFDITDIYGFLQRSDKLANA